MRRFIAASISTILVVSMIPVCMPSQASADDDLDSLQSAVESTAAAYDEASAKADALQAQIDENTSRIAEIEQELPEKEAASDTAVRNIYVYQSDFSSFLTLILDADNFEDLLASANYLERLMNKNFDAVEEAQDLKGELQDKQAQLEADKADVDAEKDNAAIALQAAKDAREQAYQQAVEKAAEQAAAAAASTQAASETQTTATASTQESETAATTQTSEESQTPSVSAGEVDWSSDKTAFVDSWAERIDSYLSGSALDGEGRAFATAAWDYGVDPRWSPAIAYVESSLGADCFASYNAWGWSKHSFSSWDDGIDQHVAYLARSYGSTLSIEAAEKYCPDTYQEWYNNVYNQMQQI